MSQTNNRIIKNQKKTQDLRINRQITAPEVRVLDREGEALGVMSLKEAINAVYQIINSEGIEMDLVEISPNANPPVCKIMNYSKYLYEKNKKEKLNKKQSKAVKLKEIVIKPAIDVHDFEHKCKQAKSFLEKGDKVKVMLRMSGRELQHVEKNVERLKEFVENLKDISKIEQPIKRDNRIVSAILSSNVK
jgi:translation initiation factor IF-3